MTGAVLLTLLLIVVVYQFYSVITHVSYVEDKALSVLRDSSQDTAEVFNDCSFRAGEFKNTKNMVLKDQCVAASISKMAERGRKSEAEKAFINYRSTVESSIAEYNEPWPLSEIGMPLVRLFL